MRFVLLAAFLLSACASTTDRDRLFSLSERTDDGALLPYPEASVVDVDVNSVVRIKLNRDRFPTAVPDLQTRETLEAMRQLAALKEQLLTGTRDALEVGKLAAENRDFTPDEEKRFSAAFAGLAESMKQYSAYLKAHKDAIPATGFDAVSLEQGLKAEYERLFNALSSRGHQLELVAWKGSEQLHVEGYDDIVPGAATLIDKTGFKFDDKFASEYEQAKRLASAAADSNSIVDAARKLLDEQRERLAKLAEELGTAAAAIAAGPAADLKQAATDCQAVSSAVKSAIDRATQATDPAVALRAFYADANDALQKGRVCSARVGAVSTQPPPALATHWDSLKKVSAQLLGLLRPSEVAAMPTFKTHPVALGSAPDAEVSLLTVPRADGEVITVRARLLDGESVVAESSGSLTVHSRGFVADTGAAVLWVRPLSLAGAAGAFTPSAGAYAVIRFKGFRWKSGDLVGTDAGSPFWQVVAPGLGVVALVVPRFDGATEVAWMGTLHLGGDILQVAAGMTIKGEPWWGFGVGLHRIAGVGKYFP
jgi:hypothetical protein